MRGDSQQIWRRQKQPTEYARITGRGWNLIVKRTEPGKIPLCLFWPIVEKAFRVNQTDMENHIKKRLRKFL